MMDEKDAPIRLVSHDPQWAQRFRKERELLGRALRPWLAGPIEHIGSTAVPGLMAKPVIDIMAAVASLEESRGAIAALRDLDYLYAADKPHEMHWFCKPRPSFRTHDLHLVPYSSPLWIARIGFRDRLREDTAVAAEYAELKQSLGASFGSDRDAYTEGKSEFIARFIGGASSRKRKAIQPVETTETVARPPLLT